LLAGFWRFLPRFFVGKTKSRVVFTGLVGAVPGGVWGPFEDRGTGAGVAAADDSTVTLSNAIPLKYCFAIWLITPVS